MAVFQRLVKATTRKGKEVLLKREPQATKGPKKAIFFQGRKSSEKLQRLVKDLFDLKKPNAHMSCKNDITIFENVAPVEALCKIYKAPLFIMSSNSEKRPDNLVIGRTYNDSLLDMVELHVESYEGLKDFACSKIALGLNPYLVFNGPEWEESEELKHLKSLFTDFFHKEEINPVRVKGLEHLISFKVTPDRKILLRSYKVMMKKSGHRVLWVEREEMGPRIDLTLRRNKLPSEDLMKEALRKSKELKVTKKKNISTDGLATTCGRIHVGKQEINKFQLDEFHVAEHKLNLYQEELDSIIN